MTEIQTNTWLDEEIKSNTTPTNFETLPALKMQPNKLVELEIDFSKPFNKWADPVNKGTIKAIIPVLFNNEKLNFWLNTKNPLYSELLTRAKKGEKKFKILQTGTQKETRYNLVD